MKLNPDELRTVKEKSDENVLTYISTFNPQNAEMLQAIRQSLPILYKDETMREILILIKFEFPNYFPKFIN